MSLQNEGGNCDYSIIIIVVVVVVVEYNSYYQYTKEKWSVFPFVTLTIIVSLMRPVAQSV